MFLDLEVLSLFCLLNTLIIILCFFCRYLYYQRFPKKRASRWEVPVWDEEKSANLLENESLMTKEEEIAQPLYSPRDEQS